MKPIQMDSFHFQTRGVVPQLPSEAQLPTPSGFQERSNQRVNFILEGHGTSCRVSTIAVAFKTIIVGCVFPLETLGSAWTMLCYHRLAPMKTNKNDNMGN